MKSTDIVDRLTREVKQGMRAKVLVENASLDREAFSELHKTSLGGTALPVCSLLSPFKDAEFLRRQMSGEEEWEDISRLPRVLWGRYVEGALALMYQDKEPGVVVAPNRVYCDPENERLICTPDFFWWPGGDTEIDWLSPVRVIECKTSMSGVGWGTLTAPDFYRSQLNWTLGILGVAEGAFSAIIRGDAEKHYTPIFQLNEDYFQRQKKVALYFLDCVDKKIPLDKEFIALTLGD